MRITEIQYSKEQEDLFAELSGVSCVLDICILEHSKTSQQDTLAKMAAVYGMQTFSRRWEDQFRQNNPGKDISEHYQIQLTQGIQPSGEIISREAFVGKGHDWTKGTITVFRYGNDFTSRGAVSDSQSVVYALLDPPYGILLPELTGMNWGEKFARVEAEAQTKLLKKFMHTLGLEYEKLDTNRNYFDRQVIYRWSDDWSNYFDQGKEWWGTFFWTILIPDKRRIVVIAASSTD